MSIFEMQKDVLQDSVVRIRTGKVLDNSNAHHMLEGLQCATVEGHRYVILNMADLEFLSSAGVGAILSSVDAYREKGGDIILCCVSPTVRHIFKVLDVADYLTFKDTEAEAIADCRCS